MKEENLRSVTSGIRGCVVNKEQRGGWCFDFPEGKWSDFGFAALQGALL